MTMLQLNPSIPLETAFGYGHAVGWLWMSEEHSLYWITALQEHEHQYRLIPNEEVRAPENWSLWRRGHTEQENAIQEVPR